MKYLAIVLTTVGMLAACSGPDNPLVRLATHDSFVMSDELVDQFESESGYELEIIRMGDTGSLTNQLALTSDAPVADAFFGIDNTFAGRAQQEGIYQSAPVAIDYSDVCFNYDLDWFDQNPIEPPARWRDLVREDYRGLTVVTNPNFSSPGLAFLATTHAAFDTTEDVQQFWQAFADNDLKVAGSWEDAYFSDFTRYGGDRPIVLSYASSPAAEVKDDGSPGSVALREECFRQTEFAGVIAGAGNPQGAEALVEFMLSQDFQASVPQAMFVYPAVEGVDVPASWAQFALPAESTVGDDLEINANREQWLEDWSRVFAD